ncbi:DNA-3-methyladenine glycosylase I [Aerococcaceae bacterium DSM 111020]|nr:DNA-3-methyladenine glycosylase I [Aerococcaceae bacterium DSM 111020]
MNDETQRCQWAQDKPDYYQDYHDKVWGKPEYDDTKLYKWLILECFHTGLSWQLVLSKESNFQKAFLNYDYHQIALFDESDIQNLLNNEGTIRHEGKIRAAINNAKALMNIQAEYGSFSKYIWSFTEGKQIINEDGVHRTRSDLSDRVTDSLKKHHFKWIGSVTMYSYLQAIGVINDHEKECDFK